MENRVSWIVLIAFICMWRSVVAFSNEEVTFGEVCVRDTCFKVEVAHTLQQKARGLMFRETLAKDQGMIFVYSLEGIYPFWMKNTLIPLDIVWIDKEYVIVDIKENMVPCKMEFCPLLYPRANAQYVLEVNGGVLASIGAAIGDKVNVNLKEIPFE